ncbi:hypothetical protein [Accumulibacter sp.]|uniref:hypothetical protein n=1 Tax=Accumulibacter sp. TaxID=2053492 RepID=UPI00260A76F3|nr:hypothetical protein [Accumulibacter sp.]
MVDPKLPGAAPAKSVRWLRIALVVAAVVALNVGGSWLAQLLEFQVFPRHDAMLLAVVLATTALYLLLMLIPFMPGIEIGLALMMTLGSKGALLVYLCTVLALSTSFAIGRLTPARLVVRFLSWLHLDKASNLVCQLERMDRQRRLEFLNAQAPAAIVPFILRHRCLALAVALNLPGNSLIGGGGGIGLIAGMSQLLPFHHYLPVTAVAVAPVPLWFFLFGS